MFGQSWERTCRNRDGEDRPRQQEDSPCEVVDGYRAARACVVGESEYNDDCRFLRQQRGDAGSRKHSNPRCDTDRKVEGRTQPHTDAAQRHEQRQRQGGHAKRCADGQDELVGPTHIGQVVRVTAEHCGEDEVRRDDHEAGQQRSQRGPGEATVRLQGAGQDDADAVQHDLRQEHPEHARAGVDDLVRRASTGVADQHAHDGMCQPDARDGKWREQEHSPGEQRADRLLRLFARSSCGRSREHRYAEACERTARNNLEDNVRNRVGCEIGVAQARRRAARPREHDDATKADDARGNRDGRDKSCCSDQAAENNTSAWWLNLVGFGTDVRHRRRPSRSTPRSNGTESMTSLKLTNSLATVRAETTASRRRNAAGVAFDAKPTPTTAPRAPAPLSPSMIRSAKSSRSNAAAAPRPVATAGPAGPRVAPRPPRSPALMARPGRRSRRLARYAHPAMRAPATTASRFLQCRSMPAANHPAESPATLTVPDATCPAASRYPLS